MAGTKPGYDRFGRKLAKPTNRSSRTSPGFGRSSSEDESSTFGGFSAFTGDAFGSTFTDNSPSPSTDFGGGSFDGGGSSSDF